MVLRVLVLVMLAWASTGCGSMLQSLQQAAESRVSRFLAESFGKKLMAAVDWVLDDLGKDGGFLNDPVVRILMPPPLGLVIGVAQDLRADPKAALLETLMNRAAENAIPVVGPILKDVVMNMDMETLAGLVDAPQESATAYLKEKGGAMIQQALLPAVVSNLKDNGAVQLYGELLETHRSAVETAEAAQAVVEGMTPPEPVTPEQLGDYVAEQAVGGFFKKMAAKEMSIRSELESTFESPF